VALLRLVSVRDGNLVVWESIALAATNANEASPGIKQRRIASVWLWVAFRTPYESVQWCARQKSQSVSHAAQSPPPNPASSSITHTSGDTSIARATKRGARTGPSVIILAAEKEPRGDIVVTVLPITHRPPDDATAAVEIPPAVKKHLSLDEERSWVIVDEGNEFVWPGYDLRRAPQSGKYDLGFLPPKLFLEIREAFLAVYRASGRKPTPRG
jgi:hypothetical protein